MTPKDVIERTTRYKVHSRLRARGLDSENEALALEIVKLIEEERAIYEGVMEGVMVALSYRRGSEAQVRCLEEIGQEVEQIRARGGE